NKTIETENFVIHYSPYSRFSDNIQLIAEDHEWRYKQLKSFLDVEISEKIHSYIYADNELRKKMIGAGDTTIADPVHREIHIVYNSFPQNVLKHELVHVMSSEFGTRLLKISPKVGLIEGLAVAADWDIKGIDRHQWARSMIDQGIAPNVEDIIGIGFWYAPGPKSYTIMGSFCRFLIDTYGIEKFKYFYKTGNAKVYDKTLGELVNSWKEYLFKITISENTKKLVVYKFSDKGIFGEYCPREVEYYKEKGLKSYRNNDIAMASTFFNKARNIDVSNPELLALLAHSRYYEKEYDEIIRLLEFRDDFSITDINILKNLEANVLWQRGDYENALNIFTALRDKSLPDDVLRELDIKIYLEMFDQGLNDLLKSYYGTNDSFNKLDILNNIIHSYPKFSPAYYLKGRIHFKRNEYERASKYFSDADLMLLPTNKLQIDNMLLLGISLYVSKDYQQSINIFEKIILSDDKGSLKDYATDFIKRCEWAMELL
ncbi:MAG: hypothetical protein GTO02_03150, partial [Candidatus Dadabacteria bacterium]|nr:hypothetical protein [Candidatus Dadabacteria bacterium]NIQ13426.1 hypothetical protein [Candidatus Dadabacteria bacterium]